MRGSSNVTRSAGEDAARARHLRRGEKSTTRGRVLVVDDEEDARRALERLLRAEGFATAGAADGRAALAETARAAPDVVLTDLAMQPMDGVELCKRLHELDPELPVIVMTAHSDMHSVIATLRQRA